MAKKYQIKKYYTDYKKLFSKEDLDAVAVITSPDTHFPVVLDAINNNLDVICEKPLTIEPKDSWTLVKKAKEKKEF